MKTITKLIPFRAVQNALVFLLSSTGTARLISLCVGFGDAETCCRLASIALARKAQTGDLLVATGFAYYLDRDWIRASEVWGEYLARTDSASMDTRVFATEYGRCLRETERLSEAIQFYSAALQEADGRESERVDKNVLEWRFQLERCQALLASDRGSSGIADIVTARDYGNQELKTNRAAGVFDLDVSNQGIVINGIVPQSREKRQVRIFLNDTLMAKTDVQSRSLAGQFEYQISNLTISKLPSECTISVDVAGSTVQTPRGGTHYTLRIPDGDGTATESFRNGTLLNKKGLLWSAGDGIPGNENRIIRAYTRAHQLFLDT